MKISYHRRPCVVEAVPLSSRRDYSVRYWLLTALTLPDGATSPGLCFPAHGGLSSFSNTLMNRSLLSVRTAQVGEVVRGPGGAGTR
jgi:hypothetical protein